MLDSLLNGGFVAITRDDHPFGLGIVIHDEFAEFYPRHVRHTLVRQYQVHRLFAEYFNGFLATYGSQYIKKSPEYGAKCEEVVLLIVNV